MTPKTERQLACGAHALGVIGPLWLPLLASVILRPMSHFAARHALRAGLDNIVMQLILLALSAISLTYTVVNLILQLTSGQPFDFWQALTNALIKTAIVVGIWLLLQLWNVIQAIKWIRKAWKGEDPLMHKWIEKIAPPQTNMSQIVAMSDRN